MKYVVCVLITLLTACGGSSSGEKAPVVSVQTTSPQPTLSKKLMDVSRSVSSVPETDTRTFIKNYNEFAISLFHRTKPVEVGQNSVVNPHSVYSVLGQLSSSAESATATELKTGLYVDQLPDIFFPAFNQYDLSLANEAITGKEFTTENHLYVDAEYDFSFPFLENSVKHFGAKVEFLSFSAELAQAKAMIQENAIADTKEQVASWAWIDGMGNREKMVITNHLQSDLTWPFAFNIADDVTGEFTDADLVSFQQKYLSANIEAQYFTDEDVLVLSLPLMDASLSLLLVTTNPQDFARMTSSITLAKLEEFEASMSLVDLTLELPQFHIQRSYAISELLNLSQSSHRYDANFSLINDRKVDDVFLDSSNHTAKISIDRERYSSMALTGLSLEQKPTPQNVDGNSTYLVSSTFMFGSVDIRQIGESRPIVRFNQPFVFILMDKDTSAILQMGVVNHPSFPENKSLEK